MTIQEVLLPWTLREDDYILPEAKGIMEASAIFLHWPIVIGLISGIISIILNEPQVFIISICGYVLIIMFGTILMYVIAILR